VLGAHLAHPEAREVAQQGRAAEAREIGATRGALSPSERMSVALPRWATNLDPLFLLKYTWRRPKPRYGN
jgi:hypothetical protein